MCCLEITTDGGFLRPRRYLVVYKSQNMSVSFRSGIRNITHFKNKLVLSSQQVADYSFTLCLTLLGSAACCVCNIPDVFPTGKLQS